MPRLPILLLFGAVTCTDGHARLRESATAIERRITVWPDTITLREGDTLRLRAIAESPEMVIDARGVAWRTSDSSIVSVANGLARARRRGAATIVAVTGRDTASALIKVAPGGSSPEHIPSDTALLPHAVRSHQPTTAQGAR